MDEERVRPHEAEDDQKLHVCEGQRVAIARKVNLALFDSRPALTKTLINMFTKCKAPYHTYIHTCFFNNLFWDLMICINFGWQALKLITKIQRIIQCCIKTNKEIGWLLEMFHGSK